WSWPAHGSSPSTRRLTEPPRPVEGRVVASDGRRRGDDAVLQVERLDFFSGDAEEVQDRVEVGDVDRRVRRLLHEGLGVGGDAGAGDLQHVEVVGTVADGDHGLEGYADLRGEEAQRVGLAGAVDHGADDAPGDRVVDDLQLVGPCEMDAQIGGQPVGDL